MIRHQATFLSGIDVNVSWGGNPHDLVDIILAENKCERDNPRPKDGEVNNLGCAIYCGGLSYLLWFDKKPTFKSVGTIAHEVFHLWTYWVQRMDRDLDINNTNSSSLEVDAYFISDVCDWIYECCQIKKS